MLTKANQKFIDTCQAFFDSDAFGDLVTEGAIVQKSTLKNALGVWVTEGGLKSVKSTSSTKKTASDTDYPKCMACTFNNNGSLFGKPCQRKGSIMINGCPCCPQHAKPFSGNFKGAPADKKNIPGYCAGCSLLAGKDVIHDCSVIELLGSSDGTIVGCCISRLQCHTDYEGARLVSDKPKKARKPKASKKASEPNQLSDFTSNEGGDDEIEALTSEMIQLNVTSNEETLEHTDNNDEMQKSSAVSPVNSESSDDGWEQIQADLGEGESVFWSKLASDGETTEIWSNEDDESDRELLGTVNADGEFTPA